MTKTGEAHQRWKGGRYIDSHGYVVVWLAPRRYQREHRLVMERLLGRPLERGESVHHRNGDKQDNRPENLELLSNGAHVRLHWQNGDFPRPERPAAACHPDREHYARGLCRKCYMNEAQRRYAERHPERMAARRERDKASGRSHRSS